MNIEQLKAKVEAAKKENAEKIRMAAEVARLEATLKLEGSEELFQAKVRLAANGEQTAKLQKLVDECAEIVSSVPVYNQKTRTNRVWAGRRKLGYGSHVDLMYQLATGVVYACAEHKQLMLAHVGVDLEVMEQMIEAFGSPAYYNRNYHTIVEEKPFNLELINATTSVLQSELGVVADTSKLTEKALQAEFVNGQLTATNNHLTAEEAIKEADFVL